MNCIDDNNGIRSHMDCSSNGILYGTEIRPCPGAYPQCDGKRTWQHGKRTWKHFSVSDVASRAVIHRLLWHHGIYQLELAPLVISRSGLLSEVLISSHRTGVRKHNNYHNCRREWVGPAINTKCDGLSMWRNGV